MSEKPIPLEDGSQAEWMEFDLGYGRVISPTGTAYPVGPAYLDVFLRTDLDPERGGRWFVYNGTEWVERFPAGAERP